VVPRSTVLLVLNHLPDVCPQGVSTFKPLMALIIQEHSLKSDIFPTMLI
jgi:hypothetical protein